MFQISESLQKRNCNQYSERFETLVTLKSFIEEHSTHQHVKSEHCSFRNKEMGSKTKFALKIDKN